MLELENNNKIQNHFHNLVGAKENFNKGKKMAPFTIKTLISKIDTANNTIQANVVKSVSSFIK